MEEVWKDIMGYEGRYQISNYGRVKTLERYVMCGRGSNPIKRKEKLLKIKVNKNGYPYVDLSKDAQYTSFRVHRLVAIHFVNGFEEGLDVNHKDGIKLHNHYSNLEWCSRSQNLLHALDMGLRRPHKLSKESIEIIDKLLSDGINKKEIAKSFDVHVSLIHLINKGKIWNRFTNRKVFG